MFQTNVSNVDFLLDFIRTEVLKYLNVLVRNVYISATTGLVSLYHRKRGDESSSTK